MTQTSIFPVDPLDWVGTTNEKEYRRRTVLGILESYHSNYDVFAEAVQNAVDAVEDAYLAGLPEPYLIEVTVNLTNNWVAYWTQVWECPLSKLRPHVRPACPSRSRRRNVILKTSIEAIRESD